MITVSLLSKSFGGTPLFRDLTFSLDVGITCLYGPSGCGKTTLGRILAGLTPPDQGHIEGPSGTPVILFQEPRLLPSLSAAQNVATVSTQRNALAAACEWLHRLGFREEDYKKKPSELSGGMQQRVSLARALLFASENSGSFALLDEPFRGLDSETKALAASLIREHLASRVTLVITHDEDDTALLNAKSIAFHDLINGIC